MPKLSAAERPYALVQVCMYNKDGAGRRSNRIAYVPFRRGLGPISFDDEYNGNNELVQRTAFSRKGGHRHRIVVYVPRAHAVPPQLE